MLKLLIKDINMLDPSGSFLVISLPDFYKYVTKEDKPTITFPGSYSGWDHLLKLENGILQIYG